MDEALGDDIVLLGYDAPQRTVEAGASLPLSLYWQAQRDVASDYSVRLTLVEPMAELWRRSTNGRWMEPTRPLAGSRRDRVRPARFRFAGDHAGSEYELRLGLVPAGADRPVAELSLGDVAVAGRTHQFEVPPIETPLAVTSPVSRSAGLRPALERDTMSITLYWQARGRWMSATRCSSTSSAPMARCGARRMTCRGRGPADDRLARGRSIGRYL